jgi:hypothetical protein
VAACGIFRTPYPGYSAERILNFRTNSQPGGIFYSRVVFIAFHCNGWMVVNLRFQMLTLFEIILNFEIDKNDHFHVNLFELLSVTPTIFRFREL